MNDYKYEYLREEDIKTILFDQVRKLEGNHYQHCMYVPSKLENSQAYIEWNQIKIMVESQLKAVKKLINQKGYSKEDLMKLLEPTN